MKKRYQLAIAAVAMGLSSGCALSAAQADVVNYGFTADVTSGVNVGQYYGSLSYDDSTLTGKGSETIGISQGLSIIFNYLGTTYTEKSDTGYGLGVPLLSFDNGNLLGLNYLVHDQFYIADHINEPYTGGAKFYNNASDDGQSGTQVGTVSYFQSTPVPEPLSIVGTVVATSISLLMKKRQQVQSIKVKA